jgi:hypothetical protein
MFEVVLKLTDGASKQMLNPLLSKGQVKISSAEVWRARSERAKYALAVNEKKLKQLGLSRSCSKPLVRRHPVTTRSNLQLSTFHISLPHFTTQTTT